MNPFRHPVVFGLLSTIAVALIIVLAAACTPKTTVALVPAPASVTVTAIAPPPDAGVYHPPPVRLRSRGVNLSGAEFGTVPGVHGMDYLWPRPADVDYFLARGVNTFRIPFRHERLQRAVRTALNDAEWTRLLDLVTYIRSKGATAILVPHNSARFGDRVLTEIEIGDFWGRIAVRLKGLDGVELNVTNEPRDMSTETWVALANAALKEVRRVGFTGRVLVPGNGWTGGGHWLSKWYGTPNATAMLKVVDPGSNMAFEVHQYLDADASGKADCVSPTIGIERLDGFVAWLRANGKQGFLGEIGALNTPTCKEAVTRTLEFVEADHDVWLGWTAWGAGVWTFGTTYPLALGPTKDGEPEKPQLTWLKPFIPACPPRLTP